MAPLTKRSRTSYKNRSQYPRKGTSYHPMRSTPGNQMSRYLSRNNPFPAVEYATLRYVQTVTIVPSALGTAGFHSFNATSIFDPDFSGLTNGGQPYGHDAYAGIYHHYKVMSATCSVQANVLSGSADFPGFGINIDDDNLFNTDQRWLMASKGSTYTMATTTQNANVLSRSYNCNMLPNQAELCADFGSDPAQQFFFRVFSLCNNPARSLEAVVTINYRVKMWGLKGLTIT